MNLEEVNNQISEGLEDWQREINFKWLEHVWKKLRVGGIWCYPNDGTFWQKTEDGFRQLNIGMGGFEVVEL